MTTATAGVATKNKLQENMRARMKSGTMVQEREAQTQKIVYG